jgi:hypothetical protein
MRTLLIFAAAAIVVYELKRQGTAAPIGATPTPMGAHIVQIDEIPYGGTAETVTPSNVPAFANTGGGGSGAPGVVGGTPAPQSLRTFQFAGGANAKGGVRPVGNPILYRGQS